jgi:hypothetical protein
VRLVLDRSEHADTLSQISGAAKKINIQRLTGNTVSTAIPLMTCRNVLNRRRNRDLHFVPRAKGWAMPADGPTGVRHEGGVTSRQASVRNTGTCRPDAKGETQAVNRREGPITDAGHRGGGARSRVEGSVMGPDRRGVVIRLCPGGNPQGDDRHG